MKFVSAFVLALILFACEARAQQPKPCATCCPNGKCQVKQPVDARQGRWPHQGPFRWSGATGRWLLGAKPRFR